jgi:hypothetical protein
LCLNERFRGIFILFIDIFIYYLLIYLIEEVDYVSPKEVLGLIITVIAIGIIFYAYISTGGVVKGDIARAAGIAGFILILVGPYLWLGEVPAAVRKFVEAKTGAKLEQK